MSGKGMIRIASGQGFWGDQLEAPIQQVENGPIDYLMLDYLAEVTMSILQKQRARDPNAGYARDFVTLMQRLLPSLVEREITVLANAGGINPEGCADAVLQHGRELGLGGKARVALVTGDDFLDRLPELIGRGVDLSHLDTGASVESILPRIQSANAYVGAPGLLEALRGAPHVVVTGRTADPALTYAPMIHEFGWSLEEYDRMAAGAVAGHINECGAQASGGNCLVDWETIPDLATVGYPIIEATPEGEIVVTKHDGTGGRISIPVVKEQLVYEIGDPREFMTPDVIVDFTSLRLSDDGENRVRISGARGRAPTDRYKVSIAYTDGYKVIGTLVYGWPDAIAKAQAADRILRERIDRIGLKFDEFITEYVGWNSTHGPLAGDPPPDIPEVMVRWGVRSDDRAALDRFTREIAPLVLAGPPTVTGYAGGRPKVQEILAYWPALIPKSEIDPFMKVDIRTA